MIIVSISMKIYSTAQVAKLVGVSKLTLLRWLYAGKLKEPARASGHDWRLWTDADVNRAKKYKAKHYSKKS